MKALDLFCGAGGASLGLLRAGMEMVGCYDHDADACATHVRNLPDCPVTRADLRWVDPGDLPAADFWWASPPCQPFSVAGKRLAGADPRDMFPWTLQAIAARRPAWVAIENPPGLLYAEQRGYIAGVVRSLERAGYTVEHRVLDAVWYGVPQRRRRVILVGSREARRIRWPEHTHGDPRFLAPFGDDRRPWVTMRQALGIASEEPAWMLDHPSQTIVSGHYGNHGYSPRHRAGYLVLGEGPVLMSQRQRALIQGFTADYVFRGSSKSRDRQIGNAVPPPLATAVARAVLEASA